MDLTQSVGMEVSSSLFPMIAVNKIELDRDLDAAPGICFRIGVDGE